MSVKSHYNATPPLEVVLFLDGRAGHEKQTFGVLRALEQLTPVTFRQEQAPILSLGRQILEIALLVTGLSRKYSKTTDLKPADLLLGTGSRTHLPLLRYQCRLKALWPDRAKSVVCMLPDKWALSLVDLCLVPSHDHPLVQENIFSTLGPPNPSPVSGDKKTDNGLILVGGIDHKSHYWDTAKVLEQLQTVVQRDPRTWTITTSRRTPKETEEALLTFASKHANSTLFLAADTPPGWLEEQYAQSTIAWVTADSVSMIYEALTAGCGVGVLPVIWKRRNNKFAHGLADLAARDLIVLFDDWLAGRELTPGAGLHEAERCAREILRRWWPDRLTRKP